MTARPTCVRPPVFAALSFALALGLFAPSAVDAGILFHETFEGYTKFPDENPASDFVNAGLPEISEGADELWYGGRFASGTGTIQSDLAVQKIGGGTNNTHVGRTADDAGLLFNVNTLGQTSVSFTFDWRTFQAESPDLLRVGYFVGNITGFAADRTKDLSVSNPWSGWTQIVSGQSDTWHSVSTSLPAGHASVWVAFWLDDGNGDFGKIDNILVTGNPVPEPTTFVLGGFGLVTVGYVAIRRRARKGMAALRADRA